MIYGYINIRIKQMINKNENQRNRKVMLTQVEYELPEIQEDRYILDSEYTEESQERFDAWLDSVKGKSQYEITESLAIAVW
jgi:hypothetical protein